MLLIIPFFNFFSHCSLSKLSEKQDKLQNENLELNGNNARLKSQVGPQDSYKSYTVLTNLKLLNIIYNNTHFHP